MWRANSSSSFARLSALALLAGACAAGCRRRAPAALSKTPAVPPSSMLVTSPLARQTTDFTNAQQEELLRREGERMGIEKLGKPLPPGYPETADMRRPISREEGLARTRAMSAEFEQARKSISRDKGSVSMPDGDAPALITHETRGEPVETSSAEAKTQP